MLSREPEDVAESQVWPEPSDNFVLTPQLEELVERALGYLRAGYPINLAGPAGTGKTTLALHLAARLRQPVTLIHGDDEFGSSDLVGNDHGYRKSKLIDNFIHSVVKTEETMKTLWIDNRLTTACRYGHVLIYDEFTRSRPEANNVLLSVLGERLLNLPKLCNGGDGYLEVHPELPGDLHLESAGVRRRAQEPGRLDGPADHDLHGPLRSRDGSGDHRRQRRRLHRDGGADRRSRASSSGSGIPTGQRPSIRAAIMIARVLACQGLSCDPANPVVLNTCRDVLHVGNPCGRAKRPRFRSTSCSRRSRRSGGLRRMRASRPWPAAPPSRRAEEVLV